VIIGALYMRYFLKVIAGLVLSFYYYNVIFRQREEVVEEDQTSVDDDGVQSFFTCRHCRWEDSQMDILERLVAVEEVAAKLNEENLSRNSRLDVIEENHRRLEGLIEDILEQLTQNSNIVNCRLDKLNDREA